MSRHLLAALLLSVPSVFGQDMVAVDWNGQVYALDSYLGTVAPVGPGLLGQNAMAVDRAGTVWSTHRSGASPNWVYSLTSVDARTGIATVVHAGIPDVRALARGGSNQLWAIVNGNPDVLYSIDSGTGAFTRIGSTGSLGHVGLAMLDGRLYGWHITGGLKVFDTSTGRAADVNPQIGGPGGGGIQFLAARADGKLIGGKNDLFEIDPTIGSYTLIGNLGTSLDLRGADQWYGNVHYFGGGCAGVFGAVALDVTGTLRPGNQLLITSTNHAAGALGFMVMGFSRVNWQNQPLPILLDPQFGTNGCSLLVSIEGGPLGVTTNVAPGALTFRMPLPPVTAGLFVHVQHVVWEQVPGGMSWSDGATMCVGF